MSRDENGYVRRIVQGEGEAVRPIFTRSTQLLCASVLLGTSIAVVWLHAPVMPALCGAVGAAAFYLWVHS